MADLTDLKIFLQLLIAPIIREAVQEQLGTLQIKSSSYSSISNHEGEDELLGVKQAAGLLGVATQTIYSNIGKIPHLKRHGRLYFRKGELVEYLEAGRVKGGSK